MAIRVREASRRDVPSLEVIRRQALEAGLSTGYDRSDFAALIATPDERLPDWIDSGDVTVLVAETDVTQIGFGSYEHPTASLRALYTAPEYQGRGCASALLDRIGAAASADGHSRLLVTAPLTAVGFFEGRGFTRRGRTNRAGLEMVALEKPLSR